ncbi:MAG: rhodanese-like domain-containing protein [Rhodocyclaceae bacterium]|nr:rhodanese-like domain-containing protein [Rhodocyclaceae bacterium]
MKHAGWAAIVALLASLASSAWGADKPVGITVEQPYLDVIHDGKLFRIQRDPDNDAEIDPDYARTSRPCPPYCIQPMHVAPGVETIGELELLEYLKRITRRDSSVLVIDSREADWLVRSGMIPGAIHLPWQRLHPAHAEPQAVAEIMELPFGAVRPGIMWNFENARTLVFYCNGIWCGQSPTNIKQLLAVGYPPHRLKWYRGGMQSWKSLGLATAPYKKP